MSVIPAFSLILFAITAVSLGLGVVSYAAYAVRTRRRPRAAASPGTCGFFHRWRPDTEA